MGSKELSILPFSAALEPPYEGLFFLYKNRYWLINDGGLIFYKGRYPQCNPSERAMDLLPDKLPNQRVQFFERVYIPISAADYEVDKRYLKNDQSST